MSEGIKPGFSVVGAHATISNAAEGQPVHSEVDDGIVDTPTAE